MEIYLVGGAVRDELLGLPIKERDWVVVGGTPKQLLDQGYQQVGRDFPVFLHPVTKEEYALARTERKSAPGYYGFECNFSKTVTLEDDLQRRDLTINAIAKDLKGQLIDPYHGVNDLKAKILRHVSQAFVEDPVRVLRVARFAARYHYLGFKVAPETQALIYSMVRQGELSHLIAERVWQEWAQSLTEKNPEVFLTTLRASGALQFILPELDGLFGIPNLITDYPEIDSGLRLLLVLRAITNLSTDPMVRFAACMLEVGKIATPINQWPLHVGYTEKGVSIIENLSKRLRIPSDYRKLAMLASRFYLTIHCLFELDAESIVRVFTQTDAFRRPYFFEKLLLICEADAFVRQGKGDYKQAGGWRNLLQACAQISVEAFIKQGYQKEAIREALHQERVACVKLILGMYEKK